MTYMFPSMYRGGGQDPDRESNSAAPVTSPPAALRRGYLLMLFASMFMLVSGFIIATAGYTGDPNVDPRFAAAVEANQRIVGIVNMVAAAMLVLLVVQVRNGKRKVRPWIVGVVVLVVIFDLIAFLIKASGFAAAVIPVLVAVSAFLLYRPSVTSYLDHMGEQV